MRRRDVLALLGPAALWPVWGRAQQKPMPVIGYLASTGPAAHAGSLAAFHQGLNETGFIEGRNVTIAHRWAEGRYDRLPALVADLAGRNVDLIVASGGPAALTARNATATLPIVFTAVSDPVRNGLIDNLARPGGNVTGITSITFALYPKRLELLSELVPQAKVIALLVNPDDTHEEHPIQQAAQTRGLQLAILKASSESEIDAAFAALSHLQAGALVVGGGTFLRNRYERIVAVAARHAMPSIYVWRDVVAAGGLISYGANFASTFRQGGIYAGRILKGAKPADLPVQEPTTFELAINMRTAQALGLTVPPSLLARADEVIE